MKYVVVLLTLVALYTGYSSPCTSCNKNGYSDNFVTCWFCNGNGMVDPSQLGGSDSITRWNETIHWTGFTSVSNYRVKKYSKISCPVCKGSVKFGKIRRRILCKECKGAGIVCPFYFGDLLLLNKNIKKWQKPYIKECIEFLKKDLTLIQNEIDSKLFSIGVDNMFSSLSLKISTGNASAPYNVYDYDHRIDCLIQVIKNYEDKQKLITKENYKKIIEDESFENELTLTMEYLFDVYRICMKVKDNDKIFKNAKLQK